MATRARRRKKAVPGHDPAYKRLFSHPTIVEGLLRGFIQEDWLERLDFPTLERMGNSFVSEDLRERHSDLIWLRRSYRSWLNSLVRRTFPDAILPEGVNLSEAPMLEETLIEWREKILEQGRREALKGHRKGRLEGRREGRLEGRLEGRREVLLEQMTLRFGPLPREIRDQVEQITSLAKLNRLAKKILVAKSFQELGLSRPEN